MYNINKKNKNKKMKQIIIGDIHGHDSWKRIVDQEKTLPQYPLVVKSNQKNKYILSRYIKAWILYCIQ